jgi:hypothetical protein
MNDNYEVVTIVKLKSFEQFHNLLKTSNNKNQYCIVHLDFNLFACQSIGLELLDHHGVEYQKIFYDHARPSQILDMFYDYEYKLRNNKQYDYDPTPDYNENNLIYSE